MISETQERAAAPYGPLGLVISLLVWLPLTAVFCTLFGGIAALADAVLFGWSRMSAEVQALRVAPSQADVYVLAIVFYFGMAAAVLSLAWFRGGAEWQSLVTWRIERRWWRDQLYWALVAGGIAYGIAASALVSWLYPASDQWFTLGPGLSGLLLSFIVAVVAAPFTEELLFRGWIFTSLRSRFGKATSIAISALLFALAHYEHTHLYALAVFPVGLILGAARERTGTIWATASLHALYNCSAWLLTALGVG